MHVTWLEGLGASYRIKGYFVLGSENTQPEFEFEAVAFGGNYGGHNVNVQISEATKRRLMESNSLNDEQVEDLITEVQRKMLGNEMIVEYEKLKPAADSQDQFGNMAPDR